MQAKRGMFFSADALFALSLLLVVVLVAFPIVQENRHRTELHRDVLTTFSLLSVRDLSSPYVQSLIADGHINDTNVSVLEQIGTFYVTNPALAETFARDVLSNLKTNENIGIWFGSTLVASQNRTPYESARNIDTARQIISGIASGDSVTGFSARALLTNVYQSKYFYFGGYVGDGNITVPISYIGTIKNATMELAINRAFDVYVNGNYEGSFSASPSETIPGQYVIPLTHFSSGINNSIELRGNSLHVTGGFLKLLYDSSASYQEDSRYQFPGIKGFANLYDGFFVPSSLNSMVAVLHFNNTNAPLFLTIGNVTVYDSNVSGERTVTLNDTYLRSVISYTSLRNSSVPLRFGMRNVSYIINYSGNIDIFSVTDLSGSMAGTPMTNAKNGNLLLLSVLLNLTGNRIGLAGYHATAPDIDFHSMSNNSVSLTAKVNSWASSGNTCICCGINKAIFGFLQAEGLSDESHGSLVAYYPFSLNSNDYSGNNHNGTLYNGTYGSGINGNATSLDGTNDFVRVNNSADLNFDMGSFTLSAWIRPTNLAVRRVIIDKTTGANSGYRFIFSDGDSDRLKLIRGSAYTDGFESNNNAIRTGVWQHVAAVVNATNNSITIYANGVPWGSGDVSTRSSNSSANLTIGHKSYTSSNAVDFNGGIDEVRIYNRALSLSEIRGLNSTVISCGDSIVEVSEVCDTNFKQSCTLGGNHGVASCSASCSGFSSCVTAAVCGDRIIQTNESCDDGNTLDGDGCSSTCHSEGRYKAMIMMSDGEANDECIEQNTGDAKQDAIEAACTAFQQYGIVVNSIGFGTGADETTLQAIASCGNGSYYYSDVNEIAHIYQELANSIIAQYMEQTISVIGNVYTTLYSDSYISFNYTTPTTPYGLIISTERSFDSIYGGVFSVPSGATVLSAYLTSYSGTKWTDRAFLDGGTAYDLRTYGSSYIALGDPFRIALPPSSVSTGSTHTVNITTGSTPTNSTSGSSSNKIIYTIARNMTYFSPIVSSAQGCIWNISFSSTQKTTMRIPSSYIGSDVCQYSPTTLGQQSLSITNDNDALQLAALQLLQQLDFNQDGILDVSFNEQQLDITTNQIVGIPFAWSTEVQVRTWN